jgi:hypothetical protein
MGGLDGKDDLDPFLESLHRVELRRAEDVGCAILFCKWDVLSKRRW